MTDEFYMRQALKLARRGEGQVSPNPMVGVVIVKKDRIIGKGYHQHYGCDHAEINAIRNATESLEGATVYVNLEPCSHHGKTPPCVESLLIHKPARVVIGIRDPNPLVSGRGIKILQSNGIATSIGILEDECRMLNEKFFKFIRTKIPFVTLKFAQSLDGRIATATGHSRWISSADSQRYTHKLRSVHDAILVGVGTVMQDDPELTVRLAKGRNPLRIILDSHLRIPPGARILKNQDRARTIIAATRGADIGKSALLKEMGIEILEVDADGEGHVDLGKLLQALGKRDISSLFVEGGSAIITSILKYSLADRVIIIIAPKLIGKGIEAIGNLGLRSMDQAILINYRKISQKGGDLIIDGRLSR